MRKKVRMKESIILVMSKNKNMTKKTDCNAMVTKLIVTRYTINTNEKNM